MRWDDTYEGAHGHYKWHDLLEDNGGLLGYVRHALNTTSYISQINDRHQPTAKFDNLEDAKNHIIAYYVTQKLEGT